ncbi:MAG: M20 family metallopeptidase [Planctomycetota bacterium]
MTTANQYKPEELTRYCNSVWDQSILPALTEYIAIPNKSPMFDKEWQAHGHMQRAVELIAGWCRERPIAGLELEVVQLEGRTPVIFMEIPGQGEGTVLLYGHLDKQPEMVGWREGLGPWKPVREGDKLYGRGGADDGYAAFASLCAIEALQQQKVPHARCVVLIEACEESGSYDLPHYVEHLRGKIGEPDLVICLDSGAGNFEQLWLTSSLRGNWVANLEVDILREGVHSGDAGGVVPSSFRIARMLIDRLEDQASGQLKPTELHAPIPEVRIEQARAAAGVLGESVHRRFPWVGAAHAVHPDPVQAILDRTWRGSLAVTGADRLPATADAGNVLRPGTTLKLSLRMPPTVPIDGMTDRLTELLTANPPYGAQVRLSKAGGAEGWHAPPLAPWLEAAVQKASQAQFGQPAMHMGEGGSIPFMGMLGKAFPAAQFVITGVLGPESNAHGPNEFLHVPFAKKLTAAMAMVLAEHRSR